MTWTIWIHPLAAEELKSLPVDVQARVYRILDMIEANGPRSVGMPSIRSLGDKLWEIRASAKDTIGRAIYVTASDRRVFVVHAFEKKTQKTPERALALARKRARDVDG
jgi:phage-related protein